MVLKNINLTSSEVTVKTVTKTVLKKKIEALVTS